MSVTSQNDITCSYCLEVDAEVVEVILKVYHMVAYFCLLLSMYSHVDTFIFEKFLAHKRQKYATIISLHFKPI